MNMRFAMLWAAIFGALLAFNINPIANREKKFTAKCLEVGGITAYNGRELVCLSANTQSAN